MTREERYRLNLALDYLIAAYDLKSAAAKIESIDKRRSGQVRRTADRFEGCGMQLLMELASEFGPGALEAGNDA